MPEEAKVVYQIWIEEIDGFPRIENFAQLDSLRGDHRVESFRSSFFEWVEALTTQRPATEQQLRKSFRKAARDLKRLGDWETRLAWSTYISLSAGIASLWTPLAPIAGPVGLGVGGASFLGNRYLQRRKKNYDWLMIGG